MTALHASDLLTTVSSAVDCLALAWLWRNRDWLIGWPISKQQPRAKRRGPPRPKTNW